MEKKRLEEEAAYLHPIFLYPFPILHLTIKRTSVGALEKPTEIKDGCHLIDDRHAPHILRTGYDFAPFRQRG